VSESESKRAVRRTGVPWNDRSLSHVEPWVRMLDEGITIPDERTELSAPEKFAPKGPDKSYRERYAELTFTGVLKPRKVRRRGRITATSGELAGKTFVQCESCWIQEDSSKKTSKKVPSLTLEQEQEIEATNENWLAEKAQQRSKPVTSLRCAFCGQNPIDPEQFVLCGECSVTHNDFAPYFSAFNIWLDVNDNTDMLDGGNTNYCEFTNGHEDKRYTDQQPVEWERRPLGEYELAVILVSKFKGFTTQTNQYARAVKRKKAQRAAVMLVAHFLAGFSFAQVAGFVPKATARSVRNFCSRARTEYVQTLIKESLTDPQIAEEVQRIMQGNMLRNLYPAYAEIGELLTRKSSLKKYAA
jgi:hypothetical protein